MAAGECITSLCTWTRPHLAASLPPNLRAAEPQQEPQDNRSASISLQHLVGEVHILDRSIWQQSLTVCVWHSHNLVCCLRLDQQALAPKSALHLVLAPSVPASMVWVPKSPCTDLAGLQSMLLYAHFGGKSMMAMWLFFPLKLFWHSNLLALPYIFMKFSW